MLKPPRTSSIPLTNSTSPRALSLSLSSSLSLSLTSRARTNTHTRTHTRQNPNPPLPPPPTSQSHLQALDCATSLLSPDCVFELAREGSCSMSSNPAAGEAMPPEPDSDPGEDGGSLGSAHGDPKQEEPADVVAPDGARADAVEAIVDEFLEEVAGGSSEKDGSLPVGAGKQESGAEVVAGSSEKEESLVGSSDRKGDAKEEEEKSAGGEVVPAATGESTEGLLNSGDARPAKDVGMMEVAEEVVAGPSEISGEGTVSVVAEAKVEEKVVVAGDVAMADVAQEEGNVTVDSAMYATESAPMVTDKGFGDESGEGAQALNGGHDDAVGDNGSGGVHVHAADSKVGGQSGEEKLEVEAGSFQSVKDRKPVQVEAADVGIEAVTPEAMEVSSVMDHDTANGLVTLDHATADAKESAITENQSTLDPASNKLGTNSVNGTPSGIGNKESNSCIAHDNKGTGNNVADVVEGGSKISDDGKPPVVEQQDDRVELLEHAEEQISERGDDPGNNHIVRPTTFDQRASYCLPPLDKHNFRVSDLVWGKVKSHPWWPGQIFDPSDASELALKYLKKDNFLVAYFGDNTFAWCDESQLKPFLTDYSQMEKQSSSDAFINSVNDALEEVSRRVLSGMSCSCLPEELCDNNISNMVENGGVREGLTCCLVDRSEILNYFSPENLLQYIKTLAVLPGQGGDLLELVIASSQLTAFYRSKGCPELPSFQTGSAWVENDMEASSSKSVILGESVTDDLHPSYEKPRRGRGRPPKRKHEDNLDMSLSELTEKKAASNLTNGVDFDDSEKRKMVIDFDDFDESQNQKKRSLDSFGDLETKSPTPTFGSSFKIGECIRRAASQLTGSSSIVKSQSEPTVHKNAPEGENGEFDVSSDDTANEPTVEKRAKRRRMHRHHSADPEEVLSQLFLAATEPMKGYSFASMIVSYFSDYRNFVVSATTEANIVEKVKGKRGRKRKVLPAPEVDMTDHMQDSYWSGFSLNNHPINSLRRIKTNTWSSRRRSSREMFVPSSDHLSAPVQHLQVGILSPKKQTQVIERSIIHVEEKMVDECKPTALVLSFGRSTALPSETDLIRMFSRYGPLKETETEVHRNTNSVKVVFKRRADAERAFNIAGKYGTFGPSLRSYRLVNMPFSLSIAEGKNPETPPEDHGLEVPAPEESEVPSDAMQVETVTEASAEQVNTIEQTVHAEAEKEASVEQLNTIEQTVHAEAEKEASVEQVDMMEQTGQVEAVNEASVEQVDTIQQTGQVEAVKEASVEQVDMIEQTGEAEAVNEASIEQVDAVKQTGQVEAVNEASVEQLDVIEQTGQAEVVNEASVEQLDMIEQTGQAEALTEASVEQIDAIEQAGQVNTQTEASVEVPLDATQAEAATRASVRGMIDETKLAEAPTETLVEVPSHFMQIEAATEAPVEDTIEQTEQAEAPTEAPVEVLLDTMQPDAVTETPEEAEVCRDTTQVEAVAEASSVEQVDAVEQTVQEKALTKASVEVPLDTMPIDDVAEAPEEAQVLSDTLQFEAQTEASVEQVDAIEQTGQAEALTEASVEVMSDTVPVDTLIEVPEDAMQVDAVDEAPEEAEVPLLQVEAVTEDSIEQDAIEQTLQKEALAEASVEVPSDAIPADTSEVQGSEVPSETVQFETVTEAPVEQVDKIAQADPVEALTEASVEQADTIDRTVELKAATEASAEIVKTIEQTVQVDAITGAELEQVGTIEQTVQAEAVTEASAEQVGMAEQTAQVEAVTEASAERIGTTEQTVLVEAVTEAELEQVDTIEQTVQAEAVTEASAEEVGTTEQTALGKAVTEAELKQVGTIEQTVQAEAVTEASAEEVGTTEQTALGEAVTEAELKQVGTIEQTVQAEAVTEASAEQVDTTEQTALVEAVTKATTEQVVMIEETKEVEATTEAPVEEAAGAEATTEAPDEQLDKIEQTG